MLGILLLTDLKTQNCARARSRPDFPHLTPKTDFSHKLLCVLLCVMMMNNQYKARAAARQRKSWPHYKTQRQSSYACSKCSPLSKTKYSTS